MPKAKYFGPDLVASDIPDGIAALRMFWFVRLFQRLNEYASVLRPFTTPSWAASRPAAATIPSATWTTIALTTGDTVTSNGYLIPENGYYNAVGVVGFAAGAATRRGCRVGVDNSILYSQYYWCDTFTASIASPPLAPFYGFKGQIVKVQVYQDTGGNLNTTFANLYVRRVGPA